MSGKEINDDEWLIPRDALNANDFKKQLRQEIADECKEAIEIELDELPFASYEQEEAESLRFGALCNILKIIRAPNSLYRMLIGMKIIRGDK